MNTNAASSKRNLVFAWSYPDDEITDCDCQWIFNVKGAERKTIVRDKVSFSLRIPVGRNLRVSDHNWLQVKSSISQVSADTHQSVQSIRQLNYNVLQSYTLAYLLIQASPSCLFYFKKPKGLKGGVCFLQPLVVLWLWWRCFAVFRECLPLLLTWGPCWDHSTDRFAKLESIKACSGDSW